MSISDLWVAQREKEIPVENAQWLQEFKDSVTTMTPNAKWDVASMIGTLHHRDMLPEVTEFITSLPQAQKQYVAAQLQSSDLQMGYFLHHLAKDPEEIADKTKIIMSLVDAAPETMLTQSTMNAVNYNLYAKHLIGRELTERLALMELPEAQPDGDLRRDAFSPVFN